MTDASKSAEPSRAVKLCGTEEIDAPSRKLTAGALTAELENGQLRYVAFEGVEALRGIAFLVRDQNWGTYTPRIDSLSVKEEAGSFTVEYRAMCEDANQRLQYEARITGSSDGALAFDAVATPQTDFVTNRAGFVVLHPARLAGQKLKVTHVDGREEETRFPERISPSQPVFNIRALSHEAAPGLWATCRMEGDAFEMEDQRNWTDASYKTYVRPLALPWGYTLAKGSRHEQSVRLSFAGGGGAGGAEGERRRRDRTGSRTFRFACRNSASRCPNDEIEAASAAVDALRVLKPRFLVCHADMRTSMAVSQFERIRQVGEAAAAKIVLEIVVPDEADASASLEPVAAAAKRARLEIDSIVVSSAADLKSWQPGAKRPEKPTVEDDRQGGARGVSGGEARRRHALHLHRTQPQAAKSGAVRFHHPHHLFDRPRGRRSVGDGDARNPPRDHRIDPSHDRREALSHRPERHRGAHEPLRQGRPRQSRQRARLPHQPRPSPARPVQRRLDAWLCRRLRLWRSRVRRDGRRIRPAWVHSPPCGRPSATLFRFARWPCRLSGVPCDGRPCQWRRPSSH